MTERNDYEAGCGVCARSVFVDDETYRFGSDEINAGLDNPFRCELCQEDYDDSTKQY